MELRSADVVKAAVTLWPWSLAGQAAAQCTAVVLGGASGLYHDVKALRQLLHVDTCTIIAVNDALFRWPGDVDHFATLHPEQLAWRAERRRLYGYPDGFTTWTRPYAAGMKEREALCDQVLAGWEDGSSGLFAVGVALELGFRRVVLCGVPMDASPHLGRGGVPWAGHASHRDAWLARQPQLAPVLRSLSGWTRELFGAPDHEWLSTVDLTADAALL